MEVNDVKKYLNKIRTYRKMLENIYDNITELEAETDVHSPSLEYHDVSSHKSKDTIYLERLDHIEGLKKEYAAIEVKRRKIVSLISKLDNCREYQCLYKRFYKEMSNEQIAEELDMCESSVRRYIASGCKNLMKYIPDQEGIE